MSESEVRKYAYAMQIEVQRLIAEENAAGAVRICSSCLMTRRRAAWCVRAPRASHLRLRQH